MHRLYSIKKRSFRDDRQSTDTWSHIVPEYLMMSLLSRSSATGLVVKYRPKVLTLNEWMPSLLTFWRVSMQFSCQSSHPMERFRPAMRLFFLVTEFKQATSLSYVDVRTGHLSWRLKKYFVESPSKAATCVCVDEVQKLWTAWCNSTASVTFQKLVVGQNRWRMLRFVWAEGRSRIHSVFESDADKPSIVFQRL